MKTLDPDLQRDRGREALITMVAALGLIGCADSPTVPVPAGSASGVVVTITTSMVSAGDLVGLTFSPTRPCFNEDAQMEVQLSWNPARFGRIGAPDLEVEQGREGHVLIRGMDRDGFSSGMNLTFRALADGSTTSFVVEQVVLRCERGTVVALQHPPLLAARHP